MKSNEVASGLKRVLIYRPSPAFGPMYLCADRSLSSERSQAAEFWDIQFDAVVAENWIVNQPEKAQMEEVINQDPFAGCSPERHARICPEL